VRGLIRALDCFRFGLCRSAVAIDRGDVAVQKHVGASYGRQRPAPIGSCWCSSRTATQCRACGNRSRASPWSAPYPRRCWQLNALVPGQPTHVFAEAEVAQVLGVTQSGDFGHGANGPQASGSAFWRVARVGALSTKGVADQRWGHSG